MLDMVLVVLLVLGILIGIKRGFILQLLHMIGFFASLFVAYTYYDDLAPKLRLWIPYPDFDAEGVMKVFMDGIEFDEAFYRAVSFVVIFIAVRIALSIIGSTLDIVASLPIIKTVNVILGGILGFIEMYLLAFIILYIVAFLPLTSIQTALDQSSIANWMIKETPYFSEELRKWLIDYVQK